MIQLLVATRNRHKVGEIQAMLGPEVRCCGLADFAGAPPLVEDQPTFTGNATAKARQVLHWLQPPSEPGNTARAQGIHFVLADDSGLEVDALHGGPGVRSARFAADDAGPSRNASDTDNNAKLLRLLGDRPASARTARFRCVLALLEISRPPGGVVAPPDDAVTLFEGCCEGYIGFSPRGTHGFGYDPLFIPTGFEQSFAELGDDTKNRISHRSRAVEALQRHLESRGFHDAPPPGKPLAGSKTQC